MDVLTRILLFFKVTDYSTVQELYQVVLFGCHRLADLYCFTVQFKSCHERFEFAIRLCEFSRDVDMLQHLRIRVQN